MRRAERIICISRFTAQEAMTLLAIPASKLETIYLGSDFAPDMSPAQEQKPAFNVPERFFLFVGSIEPGKNLALLKAAYTIAMARHIEVPPLVIVGVRWEGVAREDAPPAAWQYVGYQPDATLCWLYHRALALVFPSKYEGFGLPVLEAMSLGCPVICSQVAGLPEVGGSAVWYADQTPEAYMNAMMELSRDDTIRKHLQEAGYRQSRKFSWRLCAQETCEVYRKIIQS